MFTNPTTHEQPVANKIRTYRQEADDCRVVHILMNPLSPKMHPREREPQLLRARARSIVSLVSPRARLSFNHLLITSMCKFSQAWNLSNYLPLYLPTKITLRFRHLQNPSCESFLLHLSFLGRFSSLSGVAEVSRFATVGSNPEGA